MAVAEGSRARFDLGRVVSRTFGAIGHNFLTFAMLSLVPGIPAGFMSWGFARLVGNTAGAGGAVDIGAAGVIGIAALAYFIASFVFQASVVHGTVADLNGKRASSADCLSTGLSHFFPLFLMSILVGLGVLAGFLLFVLPGFILLATWAVAVPTRVVEHPSITGALQRSRELTHGHRWAVFGLLLVFFGLALVIRRLATAVVAVALLLVAPPGATATQAIGLFGPAYIAVSMIASMISITIGAAGVASMYYELRVIKEGIGPEALAAVFD